jgi:cytochrome c oxidase subunit 2
MSFSNSIELLAFHNVAYTIYAFMIISIIAWFGYNLTKEDKAPSKVRIPFYAYIAFLVVGGVGHHIFTYNTIPWVEQDMKRGEITADQKFVFEVKDHKWVGLPELPIKVECGQTIRFTTNSQDLVYGFGLFRKDGTLAMQMQINPGTDVNNILATNDIVWTFRHNGMFDMSSTEYSGPAQYSEDGKKDLMKVDNFLEVTGCKEGGA